MNAKTIVVFPVSLLVGFILGSIPWLNEHLHWNLWFVIPVSGLLFGMLVGWLGFELCYLLHAKVAAAGIALLAVSAVLGYIAVDVGIYFQQSVAVEGIEGIPDGEYTFSELMSLGQYFQMRLGSSEITTRGGFNVVEFGATGTIVSFVVDMLGAMAGAAGVAFGLAELRPYCNRCGRFKRRTRKLRLMLQNNVQASEVQTNLKQFVRANDYPGMVAYIRQISPQFGGSNGKFRIDIDQRHCPACREATLIGRVYRLDKGSWSEIESQRFNLSSGPRNELA